MKIYKIFQALSLDVVFGVNLLTLAVGKYFETSLSWHILLELSLSIWLIYTADHLLDAAKLKTKASTYRHQFHKDYQPCLRLICVVLSLAGFINMFYLPSGVLYGGLIVVLITFIYYALLQTVIFWAKELCVGIIYTLGVFIAPVVLSPQPLSLTQWLLLPQVFLLAFSNLLLFSWFDRSNDRRDGYPSMVIHFGAARIKIIFKRVLILGLSSCFIIALFNNNTSTWIIELVLAVMFMVLGFIFKYHRLFRRHELYRMAGDGIFYIPIIYLLYAG